MFLAAWLENTVKPSVRPKTYRSYEQMVRVHLAPGMKDVPLSKLTLQRVQQFFGEKLQAGSSPALVRYLRVVFRVALNEAVKADLIVRGVAALATPPKVEKKGNHTVHRGPGR
jgi:integrase